MTLHIPIAYFYGLATIPAVVVAVWIVGFILVSIYGWWMNH
jgi:hypothetical protein